MSTTGIPVRGPLTSYSMPAPLALKRIRLYLARDGEGYLCRDRQDLRREMLFRREERIVALLSGCAAREVLRNGLACTRAFSLPECEGCRRVLSTRGAHR